MKRLVRHLPHYLSLIGVFVVGTLGIYLFSYDKIFQMAIIIAMGSSYVAWGIVHHWMHKDLYLSVVIEYLIVAFLGVILVFSLIFRA